MNLLLLAIVAAFVVQGQFHFGLDSLLSGRSGERLQAFSEVIAAELEDKPGTEWPDVLKRFADAYQVKLGVVRIDGTTVSGEIPEIPGEFRAMLPPPERARGRTPDAPFHREMQDNRFRGLPGDPPDARRGQPNDRPRDGRPIPPQPRPGPPDERGPDARFGPRPAAPNVRPIEEPFAPAANPPRDRFSERVPPPNPGGTPGMYPKFIRKVAGQFPYWIGVHAPIFDRGARPGQPLILVMALPSLGSGGLLLDYTPWLWIGAGVLACSVLLWIPLVRGITRSIQQMTGAAGQMAQGQFETRVATGRRDELGRLGASLNHMAGRLGEYVTGQKRFLGDIAHELCSPLARMEMALGVLEQQSSPQQQGYVDDVREEVRHMSSLVNELLSFTKAGMRSKEIELRPVLLGELCARVIAREAGEKTDISVTVDAGLKVLAEPDLLARAIGNVVRNAIRYAGNAGPIAIAATPRGADVSLSITDRGPGVSEEAMHRLMDPFYRPETARTREGGGAGLGLAIVKSCAEACGGIVAVKNAEPNGLEVTFTLRRAA